MEPQKSKIYRVGNVTSYPITYRTKTRSLLIVLCVGFLMAVALPGILKQSSTTSLMLTFGLMVLIGLVLAAILISQKVTIYSDRIEQSGMVSGIKILERQNIQGFRTTTYRSAKFIELVPVSGHGNKITLAEDYLKDDLFQTWLKGITNLDEATMKEILQDETLGATPEERLAKVKSISNSSVYLNFAFIPVGMWIVFYPHPLWLAAATPVFLPWVAIALVWLSGKQFSIIETSKSTIVRKYDLLPLLVFPAFMFYLIFKYPSNGLPNLPMVFGHLSQLALLGGLVMMGIVKLVSHGSQGETSRWAAVLVALVFCAGGSIAMINGMLDNAETSNQRLVVSNKHNTTGKNATFWLDVMSKPNNSYNGETKVKVASDFYYGTKVNDTICARIHPGALGMKWETVDHCQAQ